LSRAGTVGTGSPASRRSSRSWPSPLGWPPTSDGTPWRRRGSGNACGDRRPGPRYPRTQAAGGDGDPRQRPVSVVPVPAGPAGD